MGLAWQSPAAAIIVAMQSKVKKYFLQTFMKKFRFFCPSGNPVRLPPMTLHSIQTGSSIAQVPSTPASPGARSKNTASAKSSRLCFWCMASWIGAAIGDQAEYL